MKNKKSITIFAVVLLIGIVTAGTITNLTPSLEISNFIAGGTTSTTFSFDYPNTNDNYNNAPLVARVNITSLNPIYQVWKDDFNLFMYMEHCLLPYCIGGFVTPIPMTCSENSPIQFKAKDKPDIQYTINEVLNGTFYCYNPNYYMLQLSSRDRVTLNITSDPALYPGQYNVTIELMEMQPDNQGPVIQLIEPIGDNIFSEIDKVVPIKLNIADMYDIDDSSVKYKIVSFGAPSDGEGIDVDYYDSGWIYEIEYKTSGFYEAGFNMTEHNLTKSGSYWIYAEAKDILGNLGKL